MGEDGEQVGLTDFRAEAVGLFLKRRQNFLQIDFKVDNNTSTPLP